MDDKTDKNPTFHTLFFFCFSIHINCLTIAYAQDGTQESISLLAIPLLKLPTFSVIEKSEIIQLETEKLEWKLKHTPVFPNSEDIVTNTGATTGPVK